MIMCVEQIYKRIISKKKSERNRGRWLKHRLKSGMSSIAGGATGIIIISFAISFSAETATHESRQQDESPNKCKRLCQLQEFLHFFVFLQFLSLSLSYHEKNYPKTWKFHFNFGKNKHRRYGYRERCEHMFLFIEKEESRPTCSRV